MDRKENVLNTTSIMKTSENSEQKMLKNVKNGAEKFITKNDVQLLSLALKDVFFHGLILDKQVCCFAIQRDYFNIPTSSSSMKRKATSQKLIRIGELSRIIGNFET